MPAVPQLGFDHLYTYDELTAALRDLVAARPDLVELESVGRSHEGRDLWLATVTNAATGPAHEKPAVWVDANIHAGEVTGSTAALHLLHRLVSCHGVDDRVTRAVDTRAFYVMPRVNPDGTELALADSPTYLRSSTRPWPRTDDAPGLVEQDVDGDGRILFMRVPDRNGSWKVSDRDPRLLVARDADESGPGPYYRLLREGRIRDYDGVSIDVARENRSLDLNRNFPAGWRTHGEQHGSGPFPTSEPEVRTIVDAVTARPNICAYVAHHTFGGAILRPYDDRSDDELPTTDLKRYQAIGRRATEITGYRCISVYHDFRYHPKQVITGSADNWAYDHLGIVAFTTEFWSPLPAAGITDYHLIDWFDDHPVDDDLALLRWNDDALGGRGFADWYAFDHPELGEVELGGWDWFHCWQNAPPEAMEQAIAAHSDFEIHLALISPRLALRGTGVERLGERTWRVRLVVENDGWLPTEVTAQAKKRSVVNPLLASIALPAGARLAHGDAVVDLGQLTGRSTATTMVSWDRIDVTSDLGKAEWLVEADEGSDVELTATHDRAGTVRTVLRLSGNGKTVGSEPAREGDAT